MARLSRSHRAAIKRGSKRYWNDIRAIKESRGVGYRESRSLYRQAVSSVLDRSDTTRRGVLQRVGRFVAQRARESKREVEPEAIGGFEISTGEHTVFESEGVPVFDLAEYEDEIEEALEPLRDDLVGDAFVELLLVQPKPHGKFEREKRKLFFTFDTGEDAGNLLKALWAVVRETLFKDQSPGGGVFATRIMVG